MRLSTLSATKSIAHRRSPLPLPSPLCPPFPWHRPFPWPFIWRKFRIAASSFPAASASPAGGTAQQRRVVCGVGDRKWCHIASFLRCVSRHACDMQRAAPSIAEWIVILATVSSWWPKYALNACPPHGPRVRARAGGGGEATGKALINHCIFPRPPFPPPWQWWPW